MCCDAISLVHYTIFVAKVVKKNKLWKYFFNFLCFVNSVGCVAGVCAHLQRYFKKHAGTVSGAVKSRSSLGKRGQRMARGRGALSALLSSAPPK